MKDYKISPIFYMGNKKKLISKGLIDLFPNDINMFVDLFGGSGIVSMNVVANKYILNELDKNVFNFYEMFKNKNFEEIVLKILKNIEIFKMKRIGVKQNSEESEEFKEKYSQLRKYANKTKDVVNIYTCMFYAFSQQMRFNSSGDFNMPFGNGAFTETNEQYIKDGCNFFNSDNVVITNKDFRDLKASKLSKSDFVYLDPPYFNTTATYNENGGWTEKDEEDLYFLCEELNSNGIRFAISNVFENKGTTNTKLIEWCDKMNWNVYTFDKFTYSACGKGNSNAKEVLITNYSKDNSQ